MSIKKAAQFFLVLTLSTSWIFSGWPQIFNFPPKIQEARADVATGDGKIIYGEGTVTTPRTRDWAAGAFTAEGDTVVAAATIRHVITKAAPTRDEMIVGIQTTGGVLYIQRWNGTSWSNEWNVTVGDGNLPHFDIAFESTSGDMMVVYSGNTATDGQELVYRIWNGSTWTAATNLGSVRTTGIVDGIAMERRGGTDEIALVYGDRNFDLSANFWDGATNAWKGEPAAALEVSLAKVGTATTLTNFSFDLEFESTSGELLIVWGADAVLDGKHVTRGAGPAGAWGTITTTAAFLEEPTDVELSADPNSNYIAYANSTDNGADSDAIVWTGTAWGTAFQVDASNDTVGAGTSNNAVNWVTSGAEVRAVLTYDDANAAGIDWAVYNKNTNAWALQTDCTTACSSQPASGDDAMHRLQRNPFNQAELLFLGIDSGSDLWTKKLTFDGTNLTWSNADGGVALEATMSSITGFSADFAFNRFIPTPTFTQSAYGFFNNTDSTDVGTTLAAQDTAATLGSTGALFRLRMLLHIGVNQLALSGETFKLQFAQQSGTCDTAFSGESYADVTGATVIAYNNNATPADADNLTANASDPTHSADTIVNQDYEELNNFTNSVAAIPSGQDGKWDFSLFDNGANASTAYCLRAVLSTGTVLDTYTLIPQITTAAGGPSTAIEVRAQNYTTAVTSITFPSGAPGATVSAPTNSASNTQIFGGAGTAKPVVTLYNGGGSTLTIWYNITTFTNSVVSSENYLVNAKGAACADASCITGSATFGADTTTGTTIAVGAGNEKDFYLKINLGSVAAKSGNSTLTILGEAL
ncbi:MAG: hypothetical protein Q7S12_00085 [bacterium]|nr:hypothetical protein [bacterium]